MDQLMMIAFRGLESQWSSLSLFSRAWLFNSRPTYLLTMECACGFVCLWTGSDIILGTPQKGTSQGHHGKCLRTPQKETPREVLVDSTGIAWRHHIN